MSRVRHSICPTAHCSDLGLGLGLVLGLGTLTLTLTLTPTLTVGLVGQFYSEQRDVGLMGTQEMYESYAGFDAF